MTAVGMPDEHRETAVLVWLDAEKPSLGIAGIDRPPTLDQFGAPLIGIGQFGEAVIIAAQKTDPYWSPFAGPAVITAIALDEIESQAGAANKAFSDLWLTKSSRVIFMSYFIELPDLDDEGLGKAWEGWTLLTLMLRNRVTFTSLLRWSSAF